MDFGFGDVCGMFGGVQFRVYIGMFVCAVRCAARSIQHAQFQPAWDIA